jgi:hypothetical protein|tara:strand:- start:517 stop:756 length:240 start_codon:yes stop_codon:yes gene_type:complete
MCNLPTTINWNFYKFKKMGKLGLCSFFDFINTYILLIVPDKDYSKLRDIGIQTYKEFNEVSIDEQPKNDLDEWNIIQIT